MVVAVELSRGMVVTCQTLGKSPSHMSLEVMQPHFPHLPLLLEPFLLLKMPPPKQMRLHRPNFAPCLLQLVLGLHVSVVADYG